MRILITGANGQLGTALQQELTDHTLHGIDLPDYDISKRGQMAAEISAFAPDIVINAAAYTNVDGCAENFPLAYSANSLGPHNLALLCQQHDIALLHVSTNEVFPGERENGGYYEWDTPRPINPYGNSKAAAEFHIRAIHPKHYIVRTAWLYAAQGRNFIHTMLKYGGERGAVRVVTDEVGNPTYCGDLAAAIHQLIQTEQYGTYHFVNEGACSRWAFAQEIFRLAGLEVDNAPITSAEFERKSTPPPHCALYNTAGAAIGITLRPWQEALAEYIASHTNQ